MSRVIQSAFWSISSAFTSHGERADENGKKPKELERGQWDNKAEFILSCVGFSVGLGNVWRFPYLAYKNGGAAFVLAYLILQLLVGKPMYFMELAMGQYSAKGPTKVWDMNPAAKGVGISMCLIALVTAIYYNVIMAYTLYYFFACMQSTLPWAECNPEWVTKYGCVKERYPTCTLTKVYGKDDHCTCTNDPTIDLALNIKCRQPIEQAKIPAEIYFYRIVTERSPGVEQENIGRPLWWLVLCMLLSSSITAMCLIKGIKSSGKVVYFTATFPYLILLILLIRGATLDGAYNGVEYFIVPKWQDLGDPQVWVAAAGQMFFSLSITFGGIIMYGSYNKFHNQVYFDSLFISGMDFLTSIIAGFVVFTAFGFRAKTLGVEVKDVAKAGYGLAFVAYPEALSQLPPSQLWCIIFFFMLFTLGLDSEFALLETCLTSMEDEMPYLRRHKSVLTVITVFSGFLLGLPCTCPGGDYVVTLMDHYGADFAVLITACWEMIAVMWVYGAFRFMKDVEYMLGSRPHGWQYWIFTWLISAPLSIMILVMARLVDYQAPKYDNGDPFPVFAQVIGWMLMLTILSPVPILLVLRFMESSDRPDGQTRWSFMVSPTREWKPNDNRRSTRPSFPRTGRLPLQYRPSTPKRLPLSQSRQLESLSQSAQSDQSSASV